MQATFLFVQIKCKTAVYNTAIQLPQPSLATHMRSITMMR